MRMLHFGNRNLGWFFLAALIGLLCSTGFDQPALAQDAVKIGLVGPTTGPVAYYGTLMQKGGLLAADEINKAGGITIGGKKMKLEIIHEDDAAKPQESVAVVEKLITQQKIAALVGSFTSSATLANLEVTGRYGITQITPIAVADAITKDHSWVFRNCPNNTTQTTQMAEWAVKKSGLKKFALLLQNDDYGRTAGEVFQNAAKAANVPVATTEYFKLGDADFSTQLTKINAQGADGIFLVALVAEGAQVVKQARSMGMKQSFFGLGGFASDKFIELAAGAAEGMIHISYWEPNPKIAKSMTFAEAMKKFSGLEAEMFSAATYDAVYIVKEALEKAGCASQDAACQKKIQEAMLKTDYTGAQGRTWFDKDGQGQICFYVVKVQNGKRSILDNICPPEKK